MVKIVVPNWIEDETLARLSAHGDVVTSEGRDPLADDELRDGQLGGGCLG